MNKKWGWHRLRALAQLAGIMAIAAGLAWLTHHYRLRADWTGSQHHSLSPTTQTLLRQMPDEISIEIFAQDNPALRTKVEEIMQAYREVKNNITIGYTDPKINSERARSENIFSEGEWVIRYRGRSQHITQQPNELSLSTALQRLARNGDQWLAFITGHAERSLQTVANHDITDFGSELKRRGFNVQPLNLIDGKTIPDNVSVVVIASPQTYYLPGETQLIRQYIERGGNLLWLIEPNTDLHGLEPLAERLGLETLPGILADSKVSLLGINDPTMIYINEYPPHTVMRALQGPTLFPRATGLEWQNTANWSNEILLQSNENSWNESAPDTPPLQLNIEADERSGPHPVGLALTRPHPQANEAERPQQQRIAIIGDGDFLSNQFIGNGANLMLGTALLEWLSHQDAFVELGKPTPTDTQLTLSQVTLGALALCFLFLLPASLAITGYYISRVRKRR